MNVDCKPLKEWIPNIGNYKRYCDENGLLLRMEIYRGIIPDWLSQEDKKRFAAPTRRALIAEGENEGAVGFSGRDSIRLFGEFFNRYGAGSSLINMGNVDFYFKHRIGRDRRDEYIPKNFLSSLIDSYDYAVLNQVKEAIYFYNTDRISKDILNYLYAVNYDPGTTVECPYTHEDVQVSMDFLKMMAIRTTGKEMTNDETLKFAQEIQRKYVAAINNQNADITQTDIYRELFNAHVKNVKEKVLQPFIKNPSFREAVKSFGTHEFDTFDTRLKEHVIYMIGNLVAKFGYTEQGAKEICLYVIDKKLTEKFS